MTKLFHFFHGLIIFFFLDFRKVSTSIEVYGVLSTIINMNLRNKDTTFDEWAINLKRVIENDTSSGRARKLVQILPFGKYSVSCFICCCFVLYFFVFWEIVGISSRGTIGSLAEWLRALSLRSKGPKFYPRPHR